MTGEAAIERGRRRDWPTAGLGPWLTVAAPVALLILGLAAFSPALVTQDFWLALVSGREVAQHGLPHADHLTVMASGRHWVDQQWLGQLVLYEAERIGGVGAAAALCLSAIASALAIAGLVAHRRGAAPLAILVFLVLCIAAAPWGMQFRPQALALPLFSLTLFLLVRDPLARRNSTLWVLPLLCLWANVHGSAVLGVLLLMLFGLQALVRAAHSPERWRAVACLALSPLTLFASPYATSLSAYYRLLLVDPPFGREVREWQRTTPSWLTAVFFLLVALAVVLVITRRKRLGLFDALVLGLTLVTALDAIRGIVWFGLACVALLPALATKRPGAVSFRGRAADVSAWAAVAVGIGAIVWVGARSATSYSVHFPHALAPTIQAQTTSRTGRIFAEDASADWLLWKLPSLRGRVAYDVRFELLTSSQISRLVAWDRLGPGWQRAVAGYRFVVADPKHVDALVARGGWRRLVTSDRVELAERVGRHAHRQT
jgi:hypothetical protein